MHKNDEPTWNSEKLPLQFWLSKTTNRENSALQNRMRLNFTNVFTSGSSWLRFSNIRCPSLVRFLVERFLFVTHVFEVKTKFALQVCSSVRAKGERWTKAGRRGKEEKWRKMFNFKIRSQSKCCVNFVCVNWEWLLGFWAFWERLNWALKRIRIFVVSSCHRVLKSKGKLIEKLYRGFFQVRRTNNSIAQRNNVKGAENKKRGN